MVIRPPRNGFGKSPRPGTCSRPGEGGPKVPPYNPISGSLVYPTSVDRSTPTANKHWCRTSERNLPGSPPGYHTVDPSPSDRFRWNTWDVVRRTYRHQSPRPVPFPWSVGEIVKCNLPSPPYGTSTGTYTLRYDRL